MCLLLTPPSIPITSLFQLHVFFIYLPTEWLIYPWVWSHLLGMNESPVASPKRRVTASLIHHLAITLQLGVEPHEFIHLHSGI